MIYRGRVKNGVVVFDPPPPPPDGTDVEVTIRVEPELEAASESPTLLERLGPVVGIIEDLPNDYAENHDHYLYGAPKK